MSHQSEMVQVTAEGANHRAKSASENTENSVTKLCC